MAVCVYVCICVGVGGLVSVGKRIDVLFCMSTSHPFVSMEEIDAHIDTFPCVCVCMLTHLPKDS